MSAVNITNVAVLDNPAPFVSPFQFEISYECLNSLKDDLEWKLIYVGSAEDETYDQLLESVLVGPVNVGNYRFVLQADPPDPSRIREEDIIGVTVLLLTCSYMGQEFLRGQFFVLASTYRNLRDGTDPYSTDFAVHGEKTKNRCCEFSGMDLSPESEFAAKDDE